MTEYMIVGDIDGRECLIRLASETTAARALAEVLAEPEYYRATRAKNMRIAVEEIADPWWNDPFLVN